MKHPKSGPKAKSETSTTTSKPNSKRKKQPIEPIEGGSLSRHGKIARLPRKIREQLNRHLGEGYGGPQLLRWLNGLPETRRVLKEHFDGQPISQQNLSQWRQGGYRHWLLQQEASEALSEFADGTHDVEKKMGLELADKLALWLCVRYALMARQLERMDPLESFNSLRQMCRDVVALRRGDFKLREQRLEEVMQQELTEEDHLEWVSQPGRLEKLWYEKTHDPKILKEIEEEKQRRLDIIFGVTPKKKHDEHEKAESPEPQAAPASGSGKPGKSSNSKPPPASGKTKCNKVEQSKTKCDSKAATAGSAPKPPMTASANSQPAGTTCRSSESSERTRGSASLPKEAGTQAVAANPGTATGGAAALAAPAAAPATATASAPEKPLTNSGPLTAEEQEMILDLCDCGSRGHVSAIECPRCHIRPMIGKEHCICHRVWEYRHDLAIMKELDKSQTINVK